MEGRRADGAAAQANRSHGRRRRGRDRGARRATALPARALRARQPDRALPEKQEAALEDSDPRRQGRFFAAAAVRERVEGTLSRNDRADRAVARRKGHFRRSRDQHHRYRLRQLHGRCGQRDPAAQGRPHRRDRRRGRQDRLVPDRSRDICLEARARYSRHRRCRHCRRHSEIGLCRERTRQGLRGGDREARSPANRRRCPG